MSDLIPPLRDLFFTQGGYDVARGFAKQFLAVHHNNWRRAEHHWELAVARTLNSTAVQANARPRKAMRRAVAAASGYLSTDLMRERCPFCREAGTS